MSLIMWAVAVVGLICNTATVSAFDLDVTSPTTSMSAVSGRRLTVEVRLTTRVGYDTVDLHLLPTGVRRIVPWHKPFASWLPNKP